EVERGRVPTKGAGTHAVGGGVRAAEQDADRPGTGLPATASFSAVRPAGSASAAFDTPRSGHHPPETPGAPDAGAAEESALPQAPADPLPGPAPGRPAAGDPGGFRAAALVGFRRSRGPRPFG